MKGIYEEVLTEASALKSEMAKSTELREKSEAIARKLIETLRSGGTVYACGNGGSAADAIHLCEELVAKYKKERQGLRAMHFIDGPTISCWANDYDYSSVFKRQAEVFCTAKDVLIGFSTSGNSGNVISAIEVARSKGCYTIGLAGKGGGKLVKASDICVVVPSNATERIQEGHITLVHYWCEVIDREFT